MLQNDGNWFLPIFNGPFDFKSFLFSDGVTFNTSLFWAVVHIHENFDRPLEFDGSLLLAGDLSLTIGLHRDRQKRSLSVFAYGVLIGKMLQVTACILRDRRGGRFGHEELLLPDGRSRSFPLIRMVYEEETRRN